MINIIDLYKNRTLSEKQEVDVYRNLHKKCFSLREVSSQKLVLAHGFNFCLEEASPIVLLSGQKQARLKKVRNVHAFLRGKWVSCIPKELQIIDEVTYNPFVLDDFILKSSGKAIPKKCRLYFQETKVFLIY